MATRTQAEWDKARQEVKAKAAKVVADNHAEAVVAKRKALGQPALAPSPVSVEEVDTDLDIEDEEGSDAGDGDPNTGD